MTSTNIDYVDTYFEFPTLTKIHGEPTYFKLKEIKNELKSNATSVTTDLGGGAHGHLGLVITPLAYANISPVPYARPAHPGPLAILPGVAQHEATRLRADHKESIRLFRETIDVEKALVKQVVAALEPQYLKRLRNNTTNAIDIPLHDVLDHLFERYGRVDADTLMDIEEKIKSSKYNPSDPLITFVNEIEELARLGTAANNPYSDMQKVQIGLRIIKNTGDFEQGLREWYSRPSVEHTWQNFIDHFEEARELLRQIRGVNMQNTAFQQANFMAEEVRADIARSEQVILQALNDYQPPSPTAPEPPEATNIPPAPPVQNNINAATGDTTQLAILQLLKHLSDNMPKKASGSTRPKPKFYCWTHG